MRSSANIKMLPGLLSRMSRSPSNQPRSKRRSLIAKSRCHSARQPPMLQARALRMGSALDILRSSAQQGSITKAVAGQQGLIEEAGFEEQGQSLPQWRTRLAKPARPRALPRFGDYVAAGVNGVAAVVPAG